MTPHPRNQSTSHERQRSRPASPRAVSGNGRNRDSALPDLKTPQPGHVGGMRPRKSVDELAKLPEKSSSMAPLSKPTLRTSDLDEKSTNVPDMSPHSQRRRARLRSPWSCSMLTFLTTILAGVLSVAIARSFLTRQLDPKGAAMSYMRPSFTKCSDFDTEHTRFASKYSLYLYRETGIDEDTRECIPILFIPGNAGSYKQVRPIAAEAAVHFDEQLQSHEDELKLGKRPLDFFSVDFNEDITAFHGQTLLDQAEYLNEAVAFILSLYHNPNRSFRDPTLPDPTSVILIGHSMGGIVARTMLTIPNYQAKSVNTIITLAAPHARAPISFDQDIVTTYKHINDYWRQSYSQKGRERNPLASVSLISIAGGGLDTVVPSDYSTLASLVPPSNGFTVFTSTVPRVWTGMDHLAITWCNQLRKSLVRAIYDVVDVNRPNQTRLLPERMQAFKKWFLTGMESTTERSLAQQEPGVLLTLEDNSNSIISQGERLVLRGLGASGTAKAHLLPVPPQESPDRKLFTLITDQQIGDPAGSKNLEVMFCSVFPLKSGQTNTVFSMNMDLSGDTSGSTRLACKNAAVDTIALPASHHTSTYPFDEATPFSYLQYDLEYLADHQFVAVIDKASQPTDGWAIAEFASVTESSIQMKKGLQTLLLAGVDASFRATRPLMTEINVPSLYSSLLTYKLRVGRQSCPSVPELFAPLVRQHIPDPHESKYFVNVEEADISMHGVAPYMPPALQAQTSSQGLTLQIWSDPTCNQTVDVSLKVDLVGSMGKLWMRYRTVFAAFPLIVVALVLRKQFQFYDSTGVFMSFTESIDQCLRRSVPVLIVALTFLAISFSRASQASSRIFGFGFTSTKTPIDFTVNDLLLGSQDPFFWFLVPLFSLISIGTCIGLNYAVLSITLALSVASSSFARLTSKDQSKLTNIFSDASPRKRIITTTVLLLLVSTIIPYQFVFMVLCIVQITTCVRALRLARETSTGENMNFYNYTHSILMLMLWILPINVPVLVVWIRNLALHWLTPFSSHHNIFSIMPFVTLVETLSTGKMVPRITSRVRHATRVLFFGLSIYAAVYGVTYAYLLHQIVNILCAWLSALHASNNSLATLPFGRLLIAVFDGQGGTERKTKKRP